MSKKFNSNSNRNKEVYIEPKIEVPDIDNDKQDAIADEPETKVEAPVQTKAEYLAEVAEAKAMLSVESDASQKAIVSLKSLLDTANQYDDERKAEIKRRALSKLSRMTSQPGHGIDTAVVEAYIANATK